jgi:DNA polymerase (family 10)
MDWTTRARAQGAAIRTLNADSMASIFRGRGMRHSSQRCTGLPNETLSQLDYVVASVHSAFNLTEAEMTDRIIRAISDPCLMLDIRPPSLLKPTYVDIATEAATETVLIEINAAPKRLI